MATFHLKRQDETLAVLTVDGQSLVPDRDHHHSVEAAYELMPAFEDVRELFEREVELLDLDGEMELDEWASIWDELQAPGLLVESEDGTERHEVLWIHFKHDRAWWFPLFSSSYQAK